MKYFEDETFPHPVLRVRSDDYTDGAFEFAPEILQDDSGNVTIQIQYFLSEDSILDLINRDEARYATIVDCRETLMRQMVASNEAETQRVFGPGDLSGKVILSPFIIATKTIKDYRSQHFNPEYGDRTFDLQPGDILALERPVQFLVGPDYRAPISSIFKMVSVPELKDGDIRISFSGDKIEIQVSPEQKRIFDGARNMGSSQKATLIAGLYTQTLMAALDVMRRSEGEYEDLKWYNSILSKCQERGIQLDGDLDIFRVAHQLLHFPVQLLNQYVFDSIQDEASNG